MIGTPFFVFFGWLSDKIGRKPIIMAGCLLAALTYFPLFKALTHDANPGARGSRQARRRPLVIADPADLLVPVRSGRQEGFTSSCDIAKAALAKAGVPYTMQAAPAGTVAQVKIGEHAGAGVRGARAWRRTMPRRRARPSPPH